MKKFASLFLLTCFFALNAQETANRFFYELNYKPKKDSARTEKLDFAAGDYQPANITTKEELMQRFEDDYAKSKTALDTAKEVDLDGKWSMNMGEKVLADYSKYGAIRHALNQLTHHRAQLGVYYRLNDIPVPGSYGPSADEQNF